MTRSAFRFHIVIFLLVALQLGIAEERRLAGRVLNTQTTQGIQNLVVILIPPKSSAESRHITTTDQQGNFGFEGLRPDTYLLQINEGIHLLYRKEITVPSNDEITIRLEPSDSTDISNIAHDSSAPDLLRTSKAIKANPALSASLILHDINRRYASHLLPTREQKIALDDIVWSNSWVPTYNIDGTHPQINDIDVSPDGNSLVAAMEDHTARLLDISSGRSLKVLEGHTGPVKTAAFSHDGSLIATVSADGAVKLWDVPSGTDRRLRFKNASPAIAAMFTARDHRLLTLDRESQVVAWSASDGTELYRLPLTRPEGAITAFAYDPQTDTLASGHLDGTISFWDGATGQRKGSWRDFTRQVRSLVFGPEGKLLAEAGEGMDQEWKLLEIKTHKTLGRYSGDSRHVDIDFGAFTDDGHLYLVGSSLSDLKVWDATNRDDLIVLHGHSGWHSGTLMINDPLKLVLWSKNTIRIVPGDLEELITVASKHSKQMSSSECSLYLHTPECPKLGLTEIRLGGKVQH